ncbi:MAG: hypothetical protein K2X86_19160 [Cytophagaceae bacterium]|nr:hypothetical protein [Cytophagaceae bacterium]
MRKFYFFILIPFVSLTLLSCKKEEMNLSKGFIKYFGGIEADDASDMQPTGDGGYIIIGTTSSYGIGGQDIYLIKTDSRGNEEWHKTYGDSLDDQGSSVQQTSDGGFILAGTYRYITGVDSNKTDFYVIKTDGAGSVQWSKIIGISGKNEEGVCARQTADGGYIVVGNTVTAGNEDIFIVKLFANGNQDWTQILPIDPLNPNVKDFASNVVQRGDGGYLISTSAIGFATGASPRWINTNSLGFQNNAPEKTTYLENTMSTGMEITHSLMEAAYYFTGQTSTDDIYVMKVGDAISLNKIWFKTYGGSGVDAARSIQATEDGGFVVLGSTTSFGAGGRDIYLFKVDASGDNVEWSKTFGGAGLDVGKVVRKTSDGGYAILGTLEFGDDPSAKDNIICLIKVDSKGEITNVE